MHVPLMSQQNIFWRKIFRTFITIKPTIFGINLLVISSMYLHMKPIEKGRLKSYIVPTAKSKANITYLILIFRVNFMLQMSQMSNASCAFFRCRIIFLFREKSSEHKSHGNLLVFSFTLRIGEDSGGIFVNGLRSLAVDSKLMKQSNLIWLLSEYLDLFNRLEGEFASAVERSIEFSSFISSKSGWESLKMSLESCSVSTSLTQSGISPKWSPTPSESLCCLISKSDVGGLLVFVDWFWSWRVRSCLRSMWVEVVVDSNNWYSLRVFRCWRYWRSIASFWMHICLKLNARRTSEVHSLHIFGGISSL